jgi:hypothetical protein
VVDHGYPLADVAILDRQGERDATEGEQGAQAHHEHRAEREPHAGLEILAARGRRWVDHLGDHEDHRGADHRQQPAALQIAEVRQQQPGRDRERRDGEHRQQYLDHLERLPRCQRAVPLEEEAHEQDRCTNRDEQRPDFKSPRHGPSRYPPGWRFLLYGGVGRATVSSGSLRWRNAL